MKSELRRDKHTCPALELTFSYPLSLVQLSASVPPLPLVWPPVPAAAVPLSSKLPNCLPGGFFLPLCIFNESILNRHGPSLPFPGLLMFTWSLRELHHPRPSSWILKDNNCFPVSILSSSFFELELILHSTKILVTPHTRLLSLWVGALISMFSPRVLDPFLY